MPTPVEVLPRSVPPAIVGAIRGVLIAAGLAAGTAAAAALTSLDLSDIPAEWRPVAAALLVVAVRAIEGAVDQWRGQAPQAGPLGGAPADPLHYLDTTGDKVVAAAAVRTGLERVDELTDGAITVGHLVPEANPAPIRIDVAGAMEAAGWSDEDVAAAFAAVRRPLAHTPPDVAGG